MKEKIYICDYNDLGENKEDYIEDYNKTAAECGEDDTIAVDCIVGDAWTRDGIDYREVTMIEDYNLSTEGGIKYCLEDKFGFDLKSNEGRISANYRHSSESNSVFYDVDPDSNTGYTVEVSLIDGATRHCGFSQGCVWTEWEGRDEEEEGPEDLMAARREYEIVDSILPQITPEEWERINAGYPGLPRDMMDCKDIKEKYGLSWNELRRLWGTHYEPTLHYKLDIVQALAERGHTWSSLKKSKLIGQGTLQKLSRGELISLTSLETICRLLDMQPGELIEYK